MHVRIDQKILARLKNCKVYLRRLKIFTDSEHQDLVAVAERPEPVDSSGLSDLHVDAGGVCCRWNRSSLPEICTSCKPEQSSFD